MTQTKVPFENIVGKGENVINQPYFTTMLSFFPAPNFNFSFLLILLPANVFNLDQSKIMSFDKDLNSIPNDKILALTKLKTFAEDKFSIAKMIIPVFDRVLKNTVGKGENAGYQHFILFLLCF